MDFCTGMDTGLEEVVTFSESFSYNFMGYFNFFILAFNFPESSH